MVVGLTWILRNKEKWLNKLKRGAKLAEKKKKGQRESEKEGNNMKGNVGKI
jgi:hypothetical protein